MFSMVALAGMVIRVASAFWITALAHQFLLDGALANGVTSQAMQQGGMGLVLTTLILTARPIAAFFFQGYAVQLHGIFADKRWCRRCPECGWKAAGDVYAECSCAGFSEWK